MKGLFITFEGIEGCGKSTQIQMLKEHIEESGHSVDVTREPGGTPIAEAIRHLLLDPKNAGMAPETELLLYQAARAQHVGERIRPALEQGRIVLCDRFIDSTAAYQGAGRDLPLVELDGINTLATGGLEPGLTILIDLPAEEGLKRATSQSGSDRIELESIEFHRNVRSAFLELAQKEPHRIKTVDGLMTREQVAAHIAALVDPLLDERRP